LITPSLAAPADTAGQRGQIVCRPVPFDEIPRAAWDRLVDATPGATPFSRWTMHRAWWDAYGATAHEQYMVCTTGNTTAPAEDDIRAIVPFMHRHEVEPDDARTATLLRRHTETGTRVRPDAKAIFFGASYHADYATVLAAAEDLADISSALVGALAGPPDESHGEQPWDAVDLRRLRHDDPVLPALESAFRAHADSNGWRIAREQEDVCPVVDLPDGDFEQYLGTLGKKARHEIRRKVRRAESAGGLELRLAQPDPEAVGRFIDLHQARFGSEGLFPDTEGGERSRRFVHRLAELETAEPDGGQLQLPEVYCGSKLIFAALAFDDGQSTYLYNAGMDPDSSALSPGVTGVAAYLRDRLEAGRRRFDFLRGDEPYKYEWGAQDEPIERLLVLREATA
jgi:CelD/BcsL family acetyltransferase involved in cellulose biosynthesis